SVSIDAAFLDFHLLRASAGGFDSLPYTNPRILFSASATKKNSGLAELNPSMSASVAVTSHEAYLSAIATTWSRSLILNFLTLRSEERRVGKECRSLLWQYD